MLVRLCPKYSKLGSAVCERTSFRYTSWVSKRHRNHRSSCQHSLDGEHSQKAREFQKNIYFYFIDYIKAFDCVDHNKLWKIFKVMGISEHFTCLLRNLYMGIGDTKIGYQILRSWWDSESISRNERGLPLA